MLATKHINFGVLKLFWNIVTFKNGTSFQDILVMRPDFNVCVFFYNFIFHTFMFTRNLPTK